MEAWLKKLGIGAVNPGVFDGTWRGGATVDSASPIDGKVIARVREATPADYERAVRRAHEAFLKWRVTPAPMRGEIIRQLGNALRDAKHDLGRSSRSETGKIIAEGEGEVQEMIDICDFAVGLSRQLYGLTIACERPGHRMMEQWHPLGVVGIITRLQLPRRRLGLEHRAGRRLRRRHRLEALQPNAAHRHRHHSIAERVCRANGVDPAIFTLRHRRRRDGRRSAAQRPARPARLRHRLVRRWGAASPKSSAAASAAPSSNSAATTPSSSRPAPTSTWPLRAILFGAVGTAGQRCTTHAPHHRPRIRRDEAVTPARRRPTSRSASATR